jgi:small neutral amino acid transporter SnatA (MarC family)
LVAGEYKILRGMEPLIPALGTFSQREKDDVAKIVPLTFPLPWGEGALCVLLKTLRAGEGFRAFR